MATRRFYIAISRRLEGQRELLRRLVFGVMVGGFALLAAASLLMSQPHLVVSLGGRLWFSAVCVLGVLWLATGLFNPHRDHLNGSIQESWAAFTLNAMLVAAIAAWFME